MSRDGAGRKREGHDGLVVIMIADSSRRKKGFDRTGQRGTEQKKNACSVNVKQKQKKKTYVRKEKTSNPSRAETSPKSRTSPSLVAIPPRKKAMMTGSGRQNSN